MKTEIQIQNMIDSFEEHLAELGKRATTTPQIALACWEEGIIYALKWILDKNSK